MTLGWDRSRTSTMSLMRDRRDLMLQRSVSHTISLNVHTHQGGLEARRGQQILP